MEKVAASGVSSSSRSDWACELNRGSRNCVDVLDGATNQDVCRTQVILDQDAARLVGQNDGAPGFPCPFSEEDDAHVNPCALPALHPSRRRARPPPGTP